MAKVFAFVCFVVPEKEKDAGSKAFGLSSLCLRPISHLIASILHTIVIFLCQKKPKFAILFLADKKRKYKMYKYFLLERSGCKENIRPFGGMFGEKGPREGCFEGTV